MIPALARYREIRSQLRSLYLKSEVAIHPSTVKAIEAEIDRLEHEAATIMLTDEERNGE